MNKNQYIIFFQLKNAKLLLFCTALLYSSTAFSYEVWMGLLCTPQNAALLPNTWSNTAALVEGVNCSLPPCQPSTGTPCENEVSCTTANSKTVISQFANKNNGMIEIPRSRFDSVPHPTTTLPEVLAGAIQDSLYYGYELKTIMFYNNATGDPLILYEWTEAEAQEMRDWLDDNGHADIRLMWNARNVGLVNRNWCTSPLVDDVMLEAGPELWYDNIGGRQDLLKLLWTNELTSAKSLVFQIPVSGTDPYGNPDGFQQVRRLIRWLGTDLMDWDFMRSSRIVFMPVTYNYPTYTFYPEIAAPDLYANTLTSLTLSLIEQRDLFEGRSGIPTIADCDNTFRSIEVQDGFFAAESTADNFFPINSPNQNGGVAYIAAKGPDWRQCSVMRFNLGPTEIMDASLRLEVHSTPWGANANGINIGVLSPANNANFSERTSIWAYADTNALVQWKNSVGADVANIADAVDATVQSTFTTFTPDANWADGWYDIPLSPATVDMLEALRIGGEISALLVLDTAATTGAYGIRFGSRDAAGGVGPRLVFLAEPYAHWAGFYDLAGGKGDDDDYDGKSNMYEYGLGGNPTNPADIGHVPAYSMAGDWLEYVHAERSVANSGVSYAVKVTDDLAEPDWTTNGVEVVGSGVLDSEFNMVTNRISTEIMNKQFIRLTIE